MSLPVKPFIVITGLALNAIALADANHSHEQQIGKAGRSAATKRNVKIKLDDMYFQPEILRVKGGETVRFVVQNEGTLLHEFNIGTPEMHTHHRKEMAKMLEHGMLTPTRFNRVMMPMDHSAMGMPPMTHDDPNSVLVEPGQTKTLVWTFPESGVLEFACNIPRHSEAGMVGQIQIGN